MSDSSRLDNRNKITRVHTLVIGSGAAGLNAAVQLVLSGVQDVLILTEGLSMGTSINTGSDKQTYYKLSLCGGEADSVTAMAETYFAGGGMHGDLALVEASLSARAFMHLVNLGMPFPRDAYGQFAGYKTDHDPRQRATSIGPYTSREMCRHLIREGKRRLGRFLLGARRRRHRAGLHRRDRGLPGRECYLCCWRAGRVVPVQCLPGSAGGRYWIGVDGRG